MYPALTIQKETQLKAETAKHKTAAKRAPEPHDKAWTKLTGTLREFFSHGKHGETNGFKLDKGLEVHFPPHLSKQLTELITVGDKVEVVGEEKISREGIEHIKPRIITNVTSGASLDVKAPTPPHREQRRHTEREKDVIEIAGQVLEFKQGKHGETNGFSLNAQLEVHFPPHLSEQVTALAAAGDKLKVAGYMHVTLKGDTHFHAHTITNERTEESVVDNGPPHKH
jgi:hypothetical protein